MRSQPIGVFDSGVGGISVLKHIRAALPHEDLLYLADSRHAPYGNKSPEFIRERTFALADFLLAQGAKALVVACNTATAAAIEVLRKEYSVPIIGMEPAVKPAAVAAFPETYLPFGAIDDIVFNKTDFATPGSPTRRT